MVRVKIQKKSTKAKIRRRNSKKKTKKDIKQCSPHNKQKSFSCFDKKSILRMIRSWNRHYRKNKIKYDKNASHTLLWNKLDKKMKDKCDSEYCWTSNVGLQGEDKSKLDDLFRPRMPEKWKSNPNEWLNTYDIQRVLRQYEKSRPNFLFIGAVPIDFDYQPSPGNCIVNELCNINVENLLKRGKVYLGVVFNLDKHYESGSHWVAMFAQLNKGKIYYFDSYGYEPSKEVVVLMKRLKEQCEKLGMKSDIKINKTRHQRKGSECGVYSINFICRMLEEQDFEKVTGKVVDDDTMEKNRHFYFSTL